MDNNQTRLHSAGDSEATVMARNKIPHKPLKKKGFNKLLLLPLIPVVLLLLVGLGVGGVFVVKSAWDGSEETIEDPIRNYSMEEAINALSRLDLSSSDIQKIEKNVIHTGVPADEERLNRRLMALKHLYYEFQRNDHTVQNLRNIYLLNSTDFSREQQGVLKWFFNLSADQQEQWGYVQESVGNFDDFRQKVEAALNRR